MTVTDQRRLVIAVLLTSCACAPATAQTTQAVTQPDPDVPAQPADTAVQEDIIVTAQRRQESAQRTPLSISAISGDTLAQRQITNIEGLATSLPNVNLGKNVGYGRIAIRGLGLDTTATGQEGRVAYHLDGVYLSRPTATLGTFFDVARVEVVRGPQGTLYGRNATAGAINVITNDPGSELNGYLRSTIGNYSAFTEEAAIGGPVSNTIGARLAIQKVDRSGYGFDPTTDTEVDNEHTVSARAKVKWQPAPAFKLILSGDYRNEDDHDYSYLYIGDGKPGLPTLAQRLGGTLPSRPRDDNSERPTLNHRNFYGLNATATYDVWGATLTSITGYRYSKTNYGSDVDNTAVAVSFLNINERSRQFSEELRLSGDFAHSDWIVGAYYFYENVLGTTSFQPVTRASTGGPNTLAQGFYYGGTLTTNAYAGFGQANYEILPALTLTAGARYSSEVKHVNEFNSGLDLTDNYDPNTLPPARLFQDQSRTFGSFTPRLGIQFKPSRRFLAYVTYSKGFKSGGYILGSVAPAYKPEKLTDYEGGVKATWLDGALTTNLALFYYDYTDLQVSKVVATGTQITNAASATVKGLEAEIFGTPITNLRLSADLSLLDSKYKDFQTIDPARAELGVLDLSGNRLTQAPRYTVNVSAEYVIPLPSGALRLRSEGMWVDRVYFSPFQQSATSAPAHAKFNVFATYELTGGWSAQLFMRNVTNKLVVASSQISSSLWGFPILGAYEAPRTYGASLGCKF